MIFCHNKIFISCLCIIAYPTQAFASGVLLHLFVFNMFLFNKELELELELVALPIVG